MLVHSGRAFHGSDILMVAIADGFLYPTGQTGQGIITKVNSRNRARRWCKLIRISLLRRPVDR